LPYELSRDALKEHIAEYKAGKIEKPVNPIKLAELEERYASWQFKDPRKTPWNVSKAKAPKKLTVESLIKQKIEEQKLKTSPVVKRTPAVKTPPVKTPPVKRTPAVKLSVSETLFADSLAYLNADLDLDTLDPQEAIYVVSELKPITDKIPGGSTPSTAKGLLPTVWVNKLIAELKVLSKFYDLGDLEGEEVKAVIASLKPILDKMPVKFTDKKAMWLGFRS